ncbi:MAG: hypothetical protein VW333_12055 [Pseudomonadales bacterium]
MYDSLIEALTGKLKNALFEREEYRGVNALYFEYWEGEAVAYAEALNLVIDAKTNMSVG